MPLTSERRRYFFVRHYYGYSRLWNFIKKSIKIVTAIQDDKNWKQPNVVKISKICPNSFGEDYTEKKYIFWSNFIIIKKNIAKK